MSLRTKMTMGTAALALTVLAHLPGSAQTLTFANFAQQGTGSNFRFVNNGVNTPTFSSGPTTTAAIDVTFTYLVANGYGVQNTPIAATLLLTSTANGLATTGGNSVFQNLQNVSLTLLAKTAVNGKSLLLQAGGPGATGQLSGRNLGATSSLTSDTLTSDTLTFSSDFLDFSNTTDRNAALAFTSVFPTLRINSNGYLSSFTASGTGSFGAVGPIPVSNVPEPGMLSLIGGLGVSASVFGLRRQRRK